MAARNYSVGNNNPISIEIRTGAAASCSSVIYQVFSSGERRLIAQSTVQSNGAITRVVVGQSSDVTGTSLAIQTIADFRALPDDAIKAITTDRHALKQNLMIEYDLDGGTTGDQVFDWDYDDYVSSTDGLIAVVTKNINLIN
jgi:hypothetical protein